MKQSLFDAVGGLPTLQKAHKIFYDKVYAHPWLKLFFADNEQLIIETQQTKFMGEKMGGDTAYLGKEIAMVHEHMYITQELFELRHGLLSDAIREAGVSDELRDRWLRIDQAFMKKIIKPSEAAMYDNDWKFKKPVIFPKPATL